MDYEIKPIETDKSTMPLKKSMKDGVLPPHPFSFFISGRSGSGKTNLLINLLTNNNLYGNYFHTIIVMSPTAGEFDDTYKALKLPKDNFKNEFSPDDLNNLIENRKALLSKHGIKWVCKNSRVLVILDDVIANRDFLNSPEALKMFTLLRHYHVSFFALFQSYNKLPRAMRINAMAVAIFPSTENEVKVILDEITPANLTKKDFKSVIEYATNDKYSFLYINNKADKDKRIRKNLDEIIQTNDFRTK